MLALHPSCGAPSGIGRTPLKNRITLLALATLTAVVGIATQSSAQVKKGKTRPASTKALMNAWIGPVRSQLDAELKTEPADDKAWASIAAKAEVLNESGHSLMEDGRCPDAVWAAACKTMQTSTTTLVEKANAKDLAGARAAFADFMTSCKSCHTAHKK